MEVVLASSPIDSGVACWDLSSGAEILRYRSCASAPHGLTSVSTRFFASSQLPSSSSSTVLYWSWDKPQVEVRSFPAEPIGPLLSNSDGTFLIGGAKSGNIYLWEVSSGRLLKKWQAHYRSVTCLAFPDDESLLVSGSEDGSVRVWVLTTLFDESGTAKPLLHSFTEHSLCVTDVVCGYGMSNSIIVSASEDRSCKIWSLSRGELLRTVSFPSIINAIAMDAGEHAFYAGGRDGKIYVAALNAQNFSSSSYGMHIIASLSDDNKAITCLAFSYDGVTLVSGSEDGTVRAWDTKRQHVIRVFKHAKGPVNNVLIVRHPLSSNIPGQQNWQISSCRKNTRIPMPPPLEKYSNSVDGSIETKPVARVQSSWDEQLCPKSCSYLVMQSQIEELQRQGSSGASEMELERLRLECKRATGMVQEWKKLYNDLQQVFADEILHSIAQVDDSG